MNDNKQFRDSCGFLGSVGSFVALFGYPYFGAVYKVLGFNSDGVLLRRCYRGRKSVFLSWKQIELKIVNPKLDTWRK